MMGVSSMVFWDEKSIASIIFMIWASWKAVATYIMSILARAGPKMVQIMYFV